MFSKKRNACFLFLFALFLNGCSSNDDPITHMVSTNAGGNGSISTTSATVNQGASTSFTITPAANYQIDTVTGCGGSLSGGLFTTGAISSACTVSATFEAITHTVSTDVGDNGSINTSTVTVNQGTSTNFTITPETNYQIDTATGCDGSLSGNQYTTGAISESCTVSATFSVIRHTISTSAGANGAISTSSATVNQGSSTSFTVTPAANYQIDAVTGCGGSLAGDQYTTGAISSACTVAATFKAITHTVSTIVGDNGSISASSAIVNQGMSTSFTVTPTTNYLIDTVTGCGGSLSGNQYTTEVIDAACTVSATFKERLKVSSVVFSDSNFEQCVLDQGKDYVYQITELNCLGDSISSTDGLQAFTGLTDLVLGGNQLTEIDVSQNTSLKSLGVWDNELTDIDITQNTALTELALGNNLLTTLDVTQNTALIFLNLVKNKLEAIDVSQNVELTELSLGFNELTAIDISQNPLLVALDLSNTQLTEIDLTQNTALDDLDLRNNQLAVIDVSQNTALTALSLTENQLTSIDLSSNLGITELELDDGVICTGTSCEAGGSGE